MSEIGLVGLAVMGQNLALNIAEHGFKISVFNRTYTRVEETVKRAKEEKLDNNLSGYKTMEEFVKSIQKPRKVIMLVKAGKPVDATIETLAPLLDKGDMIIDGGNEWFENSERRAKYLSEKYGIRYMATGVSGGEEGARYGPSLMPGGSKEGWESVKHIFQKCAAQVPSSSDPSKMEACVTYIGPGGAGNFVKMVHNGIEYGDMQLISEIYDLMKHLGGLTNEEIGKIFREWNGPESELQSFLIEITGKIFMKKDPLDTSKDLIDKVLDVSGSKGTGMWTVQEAARKGVPCPTISAALEARYLSTFKKERIEASKKLKGTIPKPLNQFKSTEEKKKFVNDLKNALYASKICSYTQGLKLIQKAGEEYDWELNIGEIARIWKGGCIIRAIFLDRITKAYLNNPKLSSLLMDKNFAKEIEEREESWRRIIGLAISNGISVPAISGSLAYFDAYRREKLPANLIQAQRDAFGSHTFQYMIDEEKTETKHFKWL